MNASERRHALTAEITERTGIDEALIETLVRSFYDKARRDPLLGPVFEKRVRDWEPHLERMFAFWSSVALLSGRYHGRPMEKHLTLAVDGAHFDRWLELFAQTARETCTAEGASHLIDRARRIAESLELGIAANTGVILARGERLRRGDIGNEGAAAAAIPPAGRREGSIQFDRDQRAVRHDA